MHVQTGMTRQLLAEGGLNTTGGHYECGSLLKYTYLCGKQTRTWKKAAATFTSSWTSIGSDRKG